MKEVKYINPKIFLWEGVLVDYTEGIMVAVAEDVDQARSLLLAECRYIPPEDLAKDPQVFEITEPFATYCWGSS